MKKFAVAALLALLAAAPAAFAADAFQPYTQAKFDALQSQGKTVLVDVYAPWCPTCRAQSPILEKLLKEKPLQQIVALRLDWDDQREQARAMGAPRQSTLFVYRNGSKLGTSVAETNEARLREFLTSSAGKSAANRDPR
ncbi:thioredoxin family protein [Pseudoxanthomonas dokdonensis]|uniref:Thioredoxin domain-containing protein n=1 Tax=Pseudoxanthomonas dokdonensis TaxID=344882 RepID=A0A0R0CQI3_9GAMM|nr:thioredoxin family protein [Pseudoxanthomonas dokdonensis]KRG71723.1 hypothetical protein ABB29_02065 [Pseudoxanthomonas dokdonensis]